MADFVALLFDTEFLRPNLLERHKAFLDQTAREYQIVFRILQFLLGQRDARLFFFQFDLVFALLVFFQINLGQLPREFRLVNFALLFVFLDFEIADVG